MTQVIPFLLGTSNKDAEPLAVATQQQSFARYRSIEL
jgi:hypothetical protein